MLTKWIFMTQSTITPIFICFVRLISTQRQLRIWYDLQVSSVAIFCLSYTLCWISIFPTRKWTLSSVSLSHAIMLQDWNVTIFEKILLLWPKIVSCIGITSAINVYTWHDIIRWFLRDWLQRFVACLLLLVFQTEKAFTRPKYYT